MNTFATARSFMLICFPVLFFNLAAAETYCAFEVKVSTPGGTPAPNVTVALIRADRTTFSETTTDANGVARLCDAPLEYMDVIAGQDVCGLVMVKHLQPTWPEMRRVYITYADAPCNHFVPAPDCRVLLRIQDQGGHAVAGARFKSKSTISSGPAVSDSFGRVFQSLKRNKTLEGVVIKDGLEPTRVSVNCEDDVEVKVVLHKQQIEQQYDHSAIKETNYTLKQIPLVSKPWRAHSCVPHRDSSRCSAALNDV